MNEAIPVVDVMPGGNNSGGGMFGNDGSWIFAFLIIAIIFGAGSWGGNRGSNGGNDGVASVLPFLMNGGLGTPSGQGYATRADINEGFALNGLQTGQQAMMGTVTNGFQGIDRSIWGLSSQLSQCCCDNRAAIQGVRYDIATQGCDTRSTMQNIGRDLLEAQNNNTRAILDALTAQRIEAKDERIAAQNQEIFKLQLAASQANQNAVMDAKIDSTAAELLRRTGHDCPTPAYVVQPPSPVTFPNFGCGNGYGNSCGCGC